MTTRRSEIKLLELDRVIAWVLYGIFVLALAATVVNDWRSV